MHIKAIAKIIVRMYSLLRSTKKESQKNTHIYIIGALVIVLGITFSSGFLIFRIPGLFIQKDSHEQDLMHVAFADIEVAKMQKESSIEALLSLIKKETGKDGELEGIVDDYELLILYSVKYGKYFNGERVDRHEIEFLTNLMVERKFLKIKPRPFLSVVHDERLGLSEEQKTIAIYMWDGMEGASIASDVDTSSLPHSYVGGDLLWPVPGHSRISSKYGYRMHPVLKERRMHAGIDIPAKEGVAIVAANDGVVIKATHHGSYGNMVMISHGGDLETLYAHASKLCVVPGQKVERGEKIAEIGNTGRSTGPHLHFEVRVKGKHTDPLAHVRP